MPQIWQITTWLREGQEHKAAEILERCELDFDYIDTVFEIGGEREFSIYTAIIRAPRRIMNDAARVEYKKPIEGAISVCAEAEGMYVKDFSWGALLPTEQHSPSAEAISSALSNLDTEHVQEIWQKALERKSSDPEGAITIARTLLESVCKSILDARKVSYEDDLDLPKLYNLTAKQLNLAPAQHTEEVFKQILGGCFAVVNGLGAIRNRHSDAHGKGINPIKPHPRHAELAVNLAGPVAMFLVQTHLAAISERKA